MPTPTVPQKSLMAYGAKKGATWGTAVALGAGDGLLIESVDALKPGRPYMPAYEGDTPFPMTGDLGDHEPVNLTINGAMRYDPGALGVLLALFFGTAGAHVDLTGAYEHTLQWADETYGLFAAFCAERTAKIYEVPSVKPMGLSLSVADGILKYVLACRGDLVKDDSAVNTATQIDALTYDDRHNRVRFVKDGSIKINAQAGADVAAESALEVSDFTLDMTRQFDEEHSAAHVGIIEPVELPGIDVRVGLTLPRQNAVNMAWLAALNADTLQKMLIKFTGALITGALYYDLAIFLPNLRIVNFDAPDSNEVLTASVEAVAEEADSSPTGMDYARPYVELINTRTTDYLA